MSETEFLKFPCDLGVKVIGVGHEDLASVVLDVVRRHLDESEIGSVKVRNSRNGRYQSVTVNVRVDDRACADAIYQDLSNNDKVMMAL